MATILFTLLTILTYLFSGVTEAGNTSGNSVIENEVMQVVAKQRELALKKDVAAMRQILSDDYLSTNAYGNVRTKEETIAAYEKAEITYTALEVSEVRVLVLSPTSAVANFKVNTTERNKGVDDSGAFRVTRVFAKHQGRWQVVVNHSTYLADK